MSAKPKETSVVRGNTVVSRAGAAMTVKGVQLTSVGTGLLTSTVVRGIGASDSHLHVVPKADETSR